MITFLNLITALRAEIWPASEPKTLRSAHNSMFKAALADLQKTCPVLAVLNTSIYSRCDRFWDDARSVITAPNGVICKNGVYTIVNDNWRDKVFYSPASYRDTIVKAKKCWEATTPSTRVQLGYYYEEAAVDSDVGRSRAGIWAIERRKLYAAPWLQSNEKMVIEWDGVKTEYADADLIDDSIWTRDVLEAVQLYVKWQHEFKFGSVNYAREIEKAYEDKRGEIIWMFRERTRQQEADQIPETITTLTQEEIDNDADEAEDPGPDEECDDPPTSLPGQTPDNSNDAIVGIFSGLGSPEDVLAKGVGSIYTDITDPNHPVTYKKTSGGFTSSGWVLELAT